MADWETNLGDALINLGQGPYMGLLRQAAGMPEMSPEDRQRAIWGTVGQLGMNMAMQPRMRPLQAMVSAVGQTQGQAYQGQNDFLQAMQGIQALRDMRRQNETQAWADKMPPPEGWSAEEWQMLPIAEKFKALVQSKQQKQERDAISAIPTPWSGSPPSSPAVGPSSGATPAGPPITYTDQIKGGQPSTAGQQGSVFQPPPQYAGIVGQASQATGTPPQLLASTAWNESRWNPGARNVGDQRGSINPATGKPYDSVGITQWGEQWAKARGFDPTDPNASIMQTAQVMREYADKYGGNWMLARLAYGWGPGNTDLWLRSGGDPNRLPEGAKTWLSRSALGIADDQQARAAFPQIAGMLKPGPINPWQQQAAPPSPTQQPATTGGFPVPPPQVGGLPGAPQRMAALPGSQTAQAGGRPALPQPQGLPTDNSEVPAAPPPASGMGAQPQPTPQAAAAGPISPGNPYATAMGMARQRAEIARARGDRKAFDDALTDYGKAEADARKFEADQAKNRYQTIHTDEGVYQFDPQTGEKGKFLGASPTRSNPTREFQQQVQIVNHFNTRQEVKNYNEVAPLYEAIKKAEPINSRAADIDIVFAFAKMLDPTSVVREGEQLTVLRTGGVFDQIQGMAERLNGGAALTPAIRKSLVAQAQSRYDTYQGQFLDAYDQTRQLAQANGMDIAKFMPLKPADQKAWDARQPTGMTEAQLRFMPREQFQKLRPGQQLRVIQELEGFNRQTREGGGP